VQQQRKKNIEGDINDNNRKKDNIGIGQSKTVEEKDIPHLKKKRGRKRGSGKDRVGD
jgi:hypothetical protein